MLTTLHCRGYHKGLATRWPIARYAPSTNSGRFVSPMLRWPCSKATVAEHAACDSLPASKEGTLRTKSKPFAESPGSPLGCEQNLGHPARDLFDLRTKAQANQIKFQSAAVKGSTAVETASRREVGRSESSDGSHDEAGLGELRTRNRSPVCTP